ncbi:MAG: MFS transporter [Candidatus Heimdallarchaeota archaeon]|nr:MAG: MFS transporter [Candidatus Heimdallarchaeota archaeon]
MRSSSAQLAILLLARIALDLDFQSITLYFSTLSESFNIQIWLMGFLVSVYSIFILLSPVFGSLSDQYGRRNFLTIGLVIFAISSGLMAVAQDWLFILIARALAGLGKAIFLPALLAELGDQYTYETRSRAMGFVRLSWPITFIFGVPLVGYSIEHLSWRFPFIILGLLALSSCVLIYLIDSTSDEIPNQGALVEQSLKLFKRVVSNKSALSGLLLMFFAVGAIQGIFAFFPIWMETKFQIKETSISVILAFMGVGTLFGTLLATWLGDRIGPKRCTISGLMIAATCMILLSHFSFNHIFVIFWLILLGTSFDFAMSEVPVLLTQVASNSKGTVLSINQALNASASALGSGLSGLIWISYGYSTIGLIFSSTAFVGALIGYLNIQVSPDPESSKSQLGNN